ncbi:hypothetical protein QA639_21285 [Bradyrhizobium pachyrhizi]|uniref:DUF7007 domain-containing protein n=1 Tax=Bradyrhizobium pachyrhizi TaxID=280333 RepID=UPI0024B283E1|nr:hypothetical protein [Bradyrhizobium pachyrhizi]WFU52244.1 hypothetical protein QA639_21285 [Bradyrhizobium pachyrhizi]
MTNYERSACPQSSPWGAIQDKRELAPGIWSVSTASHGGIKLSRERNAAVPKYMRAEAGWYEEDCQWSVAAVIHPIAFQRMIKIEGRPDKSEYEIAVETFRGWYPDEYEQFFDVKLKRGESRARDERLFQIENGVNFVVSSAWGDWAHWVPKDMVGVCARRESDKLEKWFLVDAPLYQKRGNFGFVIDLTRDLEIPKPERPQ